MIALIRCSGDDLLSIYREHLFRESQRCAVLSMFLSSCWRKSHPMILDTIFEVPAYAFGSEMVEVGYNKRELASQARGFTGIEARANQDAM